MFTRKGEPATAPMNDVSTLEPLVGPVHRFFMNKVGSPVDADDCTQQTFERLLSRDPSREVSDLEAFAFGVARNVLYEYWRAQTRRRQTEDIEELSIAQMGAGVSTIVNLSQRQQLVCDALRSLRLVHQTALELYYWEGKTYDQIAEIVKKPSGTVASWIRRGKEELGKRLRTVAPDELDRQLRRAPTVEDE